MEAYVDMIESLYCHERVGTKRRREEALARFPLTPILKRLARASQFERQGKRLDLNDGCDGLSSCIVHVHVHVQPWPGLAKFEIRSMHSSDPGRSGPPLGFDWLAVRLL